MYCAVFPPLRSAAADITTTGLSFQTPLRTRPIQSSAFFKTPDIPLLYSGWSQSLQNRIGRMTAQPHLIVFG
jgi:hypothetical protein